MRKIILFIAITIFSFVACSSSAKIASDNSTLKKSAEQNFITTHDSIINYGSKFLKTPYRYGGSSARGFDCSGFTSHVFKEFGYDLDRSSRDQAKQFPAVNRKDLVKGDLVFFTGRSRNGVVGHVGIVSKNLENGEFEFLHASVSSGVIFSKSTEPYYASRYLKAGRPIESATYLAQGSNPVKPGIPSSSPVVNEQVNYMQDAVNHIVKCGETLSRIASLYDVTISSIMQLNNLNSKRLKQGQKLLITSAIEKPQVSFSLNDNFEPVANIEGSNNEVQLDGEIVTSHNVQDVESQDVSQHIVKRGESLYSIARLYGCSVNQLKEWNNISSSTIKIGQKLEVMR